MTLLETAQSYLSAGLCALPAGRAEKFPIRQVGKWGRFRDRSPTAIELDIWFATEPDALCLICGKASGNLEAMDFDNGGEALSAWEALVEKIAPGLFGRLVIESTQSGGWHVLYRCEQPVCGNKKLAQRIDAETGELITLIETRGQGGLVICAPTQGYEIAQGDICNLPVLTTDERGRLLRAAVDLNENCKPSDPSYSGDSGPETSNRQPCALDNSHRPGDDFNSRGDIRPLLCDSGWEYIRRDDTNEFWRRPGKGHGNHSATLRIEDGTFYVFSSNAAPFEPSTGYSPFQVYTFVQHDGDFSAATRALSGLGYGCASSPPDYVDISAIVSVMPASQPGLHNSPQEPEAADPGPIPEQMFQIPGLVGEFVDYSLQAAPYPNMAMAFCGAMALQSHLCARKVCESGDLRTNLYILALAGSSGGKNYPRNINAHVLTSISEAKCLGDKFASGEGIQDELHRQPAKLYQNDEIDGLIQAVNKSHDGRFESIMSTLLTLFTSSNTLYPMRSKAGKTDAGFIDQPHLTIFGTATPKYYYEALSERMLTNGFFARMIIVDVGKRPEGQDPKPVSNLPQRVIDTARWWHELQPGAFQGNLAGFHPEPNIVPYSIAAQDALREFRCQADIEYSLAEDGNDEVAKTVWGRANENARKLAMLYACSENHENPQISISAARWAMAFIDHQVRRMLYMAGQYASNGEFDATCKKMLRKLHKAPNSRMEHSMLLKRMKTKAKDFRDLIETLIQRGDIEIITTQTKGRPNIEYVVKEGVL